ncbi:hypothetical protein L1049_018957 [Liquidambar formosana]|uniref:Uncharacterized protein n=1 Tax=Liquidambar formosana TaxID=63359 RepID=A0AAP0RAW4_LIQFO
MGQTSRGEEIFSRECGECLDSIRRTNVKLTVDPLLEMKNQWWRGDKHPNLYPKWVRVLALFLACRLHEYVIDGLHSSVI